MFLSVEIIEQDEPLAAGQGGKKKQLPVTCFPDGTAQSIKI